MNSRCQHCNIASEELKRCASCQNAWYCGSDCQKKHWPIHLLDCNIGRTLTSADCLGAAVCQSRAPTDLQTRRHYGFTQTPRADDVEMRLKAYTLLYKDLGVKAKTVHRWREEGVLGRMMKSTFNTKLSLEQHQGKTYKWFERLQATFGNPPPQDDPTKLWLLDAHKAARDLIARSTSDLEFDKLLCHDDFSNFFLFYTLLLQGARPPPFDGIGNWITFGFCGCSDLDEEGYFANQYISLFHRVAFEDLFNAYLTSSLPDLFSANDFAIQNPYILDALSNRVARKSVWDLKEFACADDDMRQDSKPILSISADYGFFNCRSSTEEVCLRNIYKRVLDRPDSNPLALHQACLRGELFEYCRQFTSLDPPEKFRRLMKNLYPLPDVEEMVNHHQSDEPSVQADVRTLDRGDYSSDSQGLPSQPSDSTRIEQSDLRAMLQSAWQSRFG